MNFFVHPNGLCESQNIGEGTRVWAFAHILKGARIGIDCNICDHVFIENDVVVGDRVTIKCGVQLWDGVRIEDDVFIGPNVTFTNDLFPRSKVYKKSLSTLVRKNASVGANATILPGLEIGQNAVIGAGSVVTRSVPSNSIVVGNPARIVGYVDSTRFSPEHSGSLSKVSESSVQGVSFHPLKVVKDLRGSLSVGEFGRDIPFQPKRFFNVFSVPSDKVRGEHAHRECHQYLVCTQGTCSVLVDDGKNREEVVLEPWIFGIYVRPRVWSVQYKYTKDASLLVFASHYYDPDDYIRDYSVFLEEIRKG